MKNLFISMGEDISVRNFTEGPFTYRELKATDVAALLTATRKAGMQVRAYYDFGPVPSEKKDRTFRQLVAAFEKITGAQLTPTDFLMKEGEGPEEEALPNFNFIATVTDDTSMLAVEYFFSPHDAEQDLLGSLEVSDDIMNFHFFEKA